MSLHLLEYLVGESFDLECSTLDAPTFTVSRHSCVAATADVIVDDGSNYTINGRTLTIHNVQPNDEGFYACSSGGGGTIPIGCVVVSGKQYVFSAKQCCSINCLFFTPRLCMVY